MDKAVLHQVPAPAEVPVPRRRIARAGRPMMAMMAMVLGIFSGDLKNTQWLLYLYTSIETPLSCRLITY